MYPFPAGESVTRLRAVAGAPPYHEPDWSAPDAETYGRCAVWQESSTEPVPDADGRAVVVTVTKCAVPYDADFLPGDRFAVRGETFEMVGEIERVHHPMTGWQPGAVVTGRRWEG